MVRAVVKRYNKAPVIEEIASVYDITGHEHSANMVRVYDGVDGSIILWVNAMALIEQMPFNFFLDGKGRCGRSMICGNVCFTAFGPVDDDFDATDITDEQAERIISSFSVYDKILTIAEIAQKRRKKKGGQ